MPETVVNQNGLQNSDVDALNKEQRAKLRQLKVDVQKLDEEYIRVRNLMFTLVCISSLVGIK
jgi:hypothetical protein